MYRILWQEMSNTSQCRHEHYADSPGLSCESYSLARDVEHLALFSRSQGSVAVSSSDVRILDGSVLGLTYLSFHLSTAIIMDDTVPEYRHELVRYLGVPLLVVSAPPHGR